MGDDLAMKVGELTGALKSVDEKLHVTSDKLDLFLAGDAPICKERHAKVEKSLKALWAAVKELKATATAPFLSVTRNGVIAGDRSAALYAVIILGILVVGGMFFVQHGLISRQNKKMDEHSEKVDKIMRFVAPEYSMVDENGTD